MKKINGNRKERGFFNEDDLFVYCLFEEYRKRFGKGAIYKLMDKIKNKTKGKPIDTNHKKQI